MFCLPFIRWSNSHTIFFDFRVNVEIEETIEIINKATGTTIVTETTIITTTIITIITVTIEIIVCAIIAMTIRQLFAVDVIDFLYRNHDNESVRIILNFAIVSKTEMICSWFRSRRHAIVIRFCCCSRSEGNWKKINNFYVNHDKGSGFVL